MRGKAFDKDPKAKSSKKKDCAEVVRHVPNAQGQS